MTPLATAVEFLKSCGIERPEQDVKLIAAWAAGLPLSTALGAPPPEFTPAQELKFRRGIGRRGDRREPAAYIVGTEEFLGLELRVTRAVLIPRPSTEALVEAAGRPSRALEIGTGSGAVAIALATRDARVVATDVSHRAIEVARENALRHGVGDRITFVEADLWVDGAFDLVISNPPYVASGEFSGLMPEVAHEPMLALDGGGDGLQVVRRIVRGARARAPRLLLEVGATQAGTVRELCLQAGFGGVRVLKDLDGFDRIVEAT